MTKPIAKSRRADAERAAEHWLRSVMDCVVVRRAVHSRFHDIDFFCADAVGKVASGAHVYAQVTTGQHQAVTSRRRKLETIPWHGYDVVFVLQLIEQRYPANRRRKEWWFRVHEYAPDSMGSRVWKTWDSATAVPKEWFRAWKEPSPLTSAYETARCPK
jgi:hypothetical protein